MFSNLTLAEKTELYYMLLELQDWWESLADIKGASPEFCPRFGLQLSSGTYLSLSDEYNSFEEWIAILTKDLDFL